MRVSCLVNLKDNITCRGGNRPCDNTECKKVLTPDNRSYCSSCKSVVYCNVKCQSQNWQSHKAACKIVSSNPQVLEERKMMHTILDGAKEFIESLFDTYSPKIGIVVCDVNDSVNCAHLRFKFLELTETSKICSPEHFQYITKWTSDKNRVFGMLLEGEIFHTTAYTKIQ